ncbi:sporulation integral membrane protein YtvI [Bacillus sp. 179-C3.3 HS]|uniref:sporulation integral membrane protein YtvI n=1 Tax=Bacillus sp. 179-C3.3 HS TaxID=3232162 RepID=UPI00399FDA74
MNHTYVAIFLRSLMMLSITVFAVVLIYQSFPLVYPFWIALIVSCLIHPAVCKIEELTGMPRGFVVIIVLLLFLVIAAGVITLLVAEIISGSAYLAKVLPGHIDQMIAIVERFFTHKILPLYHDLTAQFNALQAGQKESILGQIQALGDEGAAKIGTFLSKTLEFIPAFLGLLPDAAATILFSALATFFITKDWFTLKTYSGRLFPAKWLLHTRAIFSEIKKAISGFMKAQLLLVAMTIGIVFIGLIILKVEHAFVVSLSIGLVDLLPYIGSGTIFLPWIIYSAVTGKLSLAIGLGILYIVVLIQRQISEPKVLSKSIGLHPLATLIALFVGLKWLGFLGLMVGPAVLVIWQAFRNAGVFRDIYQYIIHGAQKE